MPTCGNCHQEVDFYEHGGLFYCNECDTQSQVMHVIEKDDFEDVLDFTHSYSSTTRRKKRREPKEHKDPGQERSWWSCELYQAILKAQVKALIGMGFPAKLDETVMQLWFRYLSKSKVAFCKALKAPGATKCHLDETDEEEDGEGGEQSQSSLDVLSPPAKGKSKNKVYSKDDWLHRSEKGNLVTNVMRKLHSKRIQLGVWDSVCFMYLALQSLQEPVLLSDMIRWVREGHLPLRSTADVLPEHISKNMSSKDIDRFCNPMMFMPDVNYVFKLLCQLSSKLDVTPRPLSQSDMSFIIARMIHSLNLPVELCHHTHQLHQRVQPSLEETLSRYESSLLPECQAQAYIIVSLKLLFTLDDRTEHVLSSQTGRLQQLFPETVRLFNWDVWVEAQKLRIQHKLSQEGSAKNSRDLKKVQNMSGFVQHFNSFYQVEQVHKHLHIAYTGLKGSQERLKEYQRPFRALNRESSSSQGPAPSSFAMAGSLLHSRQSDSLEDGGNVCSDSGNESQKPATSFEWLPRDYLLHEDFSKHTLKHLTNLQELCEQYIISPESVRKVLNLAAEKGSQSKGSQSKAEKTSKNKEASSTEEAFHGISTRTGKRKDDQKKKRSHKKHKSKKNKDVSDEASSRSSREVADEDFEKESFEQLQGIRFDNPGIPYVTYPTISKMNVELSDQMDRFHASMEWLLDWCSKMSEMKPQYLPYCVYNIEKILFNE